MALQGFFPEARRPFHAGLVVSIELFVDYYAKNHSSGYLGVDLKQSSVDLHKKDNNSGNLIMDDFLE